MILQPEDFWSFYEWLMRPESFLESACLQGIVLFVLAILIGLMVGYIISANRLDEGGKMFSFTPATQQVNLLGDLTTVCADPPGCIPQGKSHVILLEDPSTGERPH